MRQRRLRRSAEGTEVENPSPRRSDRPPAVMRPTIRGESRPLVYLPAARSRTCVGPTTFTINAGRPGTRDRADSRDNPYVLPRVSLSTGSSVAIQLTSPLSFGTVGRLRAGECRGGENDALVNR